MLRNKQFKQMDTNGNGYVSLAEIDKYFKDMGRELAIIYNSKAAMLRAFMAAKDHMRSTAETGQDYVQKPEYRIFLLYLRQYFEYFVMFKKLDKTGDDKLSLKEFTAAVPIMKKWGVNIKDPKTEFNKIDVNKGGSLLFDEFSHYCITMSLDLEDDGDDELYEEGEKKLVKDGRNPNEKQTFKVRTDYGDTSKPVNKKLDWAEVKKLFPIQDTEADRNKREKMFCDFDPNGNNYLSLAEIDKGFKDMGPKADDVY